MYYSSGLGTAYIIGLVIGIVACFFLAIIPSKIAKRKGYSGAGFYWFGVAALVPAIIVACCLRDRNAAQQVQQQYQPPQYNYPPQG